MKPKKFKETNFTFGLGQPEYEPLPAFKKLEDPQGEVVTCWNLSFKERLKILFTGEIWLSMLTFNQGLTPTYLTTNKEEII